MGAIPLQALATILAGWGNRAQQDVADYLHEENPALREQLGGKRLRFADGDPGFLASSRHRIRDRDPSLTHSLEVILESFGVESGRLRARIPNPSAHAERFVRSIKSGFLAQVIPLGERHLRHAVKEHAEHHHRERNHEGLVESRERLGGLLRHHRRAAQASIEFWHATGSRVPRTGLVGHSRSRSR